MKCIDQSPRDPAFVQDPYPFYDRARGLGEIVFWQEYGMPVATTANTVGALLRDRRIGRRNPAPAPVERHLTAFHDVEQHSMLELEPPCHTRLRNLVLRAFTSRRVAVLAPTIEALCNELIDAIPARRFDLLAAYAQPLPVIVIARLIGVPDGEAHRLLAWSHAMVAMYQARRDRSVEEIAAAAAAEFREFLRARLAERRLRPTDDLLSELLAVEAEGERLTEDELVSTIILLLNAGHEATVHTLGNAVRAVLLYGAQQALAADPASLVEELLRWDPPLHLFTRHVYEPVEICGHDLGPGDQVGCLLAAAGRDPAVTADPHRFDPSRRRAPHHAFGAGIHFCLGAPLARLELEIALKTLFARWPHLALAETPRYADTYHFHGLQQLILIR